MTVLDRFDLPGHATDVPTELTAGVTTFLTMAYITVVNPSILAATGMDQGALLTVTCLAAALATAMMALFTNYPFALAPGMGLNAFFAYTVVLQLEVPWQTALGVIFLEGLIFVALTLLDVREALVRAMPEALKHAVGAGIGLFLALIGLKNAGIVVASQPTLVKLGSVNTAPALCFFFGLILTAVLLIRESRGAILWGILSTAALGWIIGISPGPKAFVSMPPSPMPLVGALDLSAAWAMPKLSLLSLLLGFFFVDFFDTLGTLVGVSAKAGMLDKDGTLPRARGAFMADALGTTFGAVLGTSTVTTFVESAAGVRAGGRTGLTGLTVAACFLAAPFFAPLLLAVPAYATAPALVIVGLFMAEALTEIDFADVGVGLPAFLTVVMMPFTFSIAEGIVFGILAHVTIQLGSGRGRDLPPALTMLALLFVARFVFGL